MQKPENLLRKLRICFAYSYLIPIINIFIKVSQINLMKLDKFGLNKTLSASKNRKQQEWGWIAVP